MSAPLLLLLLNEELKNRTPGPDDDSTLTALIAVVILGFLTIVSIAVVSLKDSQTTQEPAITQPTQQPIVVEATQPVKVEE